jgi:sec-independent protein translocase protein TatA
MSGAEKQFMNPMLAILGLGGGELVIVVVAVLILFGAKRIPEFAKGLGRGIHEFKKASHEVTDEIERAAKEPVPVKTERNVSQVADTL